MQVQCYWFSVQKSSSPLSDWESSQCYLWYWHQLWEMYSQHLWSN
jgi:hypothetical protein